MNKNCTRLILLLLAAVLICGGQFSFAQLRITGSISGTVKDPSGAVVPSAKVVLKDEGTGITKERTSSPEGTFFFPDLSHGTYEVTVTAPGFQVSVVNKISVSTSQVTDVVVKLVVGLPTETVVVQGVAPVLETTSQLVTTTQTLKVITDLPIIGRSNVLSLARLMPGASPPASGSTRYNNLPGGATNVTVDGINNASNGWKSGGTVFYMTVPMRVGAVEEVSVETGGLGADSGAQSGANIKFVTRRGTNQYHGSVFFEPTSEKFNANSWSRNATLGQTYGGTSGGMACTIAQLQNEWDKCKAPRLRSRRFDYGGNFGGPLLPEFIFQDRFGNIKDKMFFFVNFERSYAPSYSSASINVMTPAAQAGNFTYLVSGTTNQLRTVNVLDIAAAQGKPVKLDPVVQAILAINNKVPTAPGVSQVPTTDFNRNAYIWPQENNDYAYFPTARFDWYVTQRHQFTFSWNYRHNWQAGARRLPLEETSRTNPFRLGYFLYAASLQSTITPRMVNEFRYGVQHSGDSNTVAEYGPYYQYNSKPLRIGGALPFGPLVPFIDQQNTTGRHYITTIYDTLTWTKGEHIITMGASYRRTDWWDVAERYAVPTYSTGTPSGDPLGINSIFNTTTLPGIVSTGLADPQALYNLLVGRISRSDFTRVVNPDTFKYDGFIDPTWTRSHMGGVYAQDRWRVKPNLTLNFGLRWEIQGNMLDVMGIVASPDIQSIYGPSTKLFTPGALSSNANPTLQVGRQAFKPDYNNFAPNFGFAWNPSDKGWLGKWLGGSKTVFRGSYSLSVYDEGTQMFAANLGGNAGKTISANIIPGQGVLPSFYTLSDALTSPTTINSFTWTTDTYAKTINQADQTFSRTFSGMDPNLRAPYTLNWNFGIQRELMKNTVLEIKYVGTAGRGAWRTSDINEVNIFENGFLQEFKNAQANLIVNQANGKGNTFINNSLPGQFALPMFDAAFGARGGVAAITSSSGYGSTSFITSLQTGAAGTLANTMATNREYVCRMFGNTFSPCLRINPLYNAPGPYPINTFLLNPYVAGKINYVEGTGWTSYNGMQVQLRKRYSHGLDWTVNYTWSKSLTNLATDNATQSLDWTTRRALERDRRVSSFDLRHVLQTFGSWELPFGPKHFLSFRNRYADYVIQDWTLGSILVFNTGAPVQLTGGFTTVNNSNNGATGGVRLADGVTMAQIQALFDAERTRLVGRAGSTDQQRLAVALDLIGADGRANPKYLAPNTTPGDFGQLLFLRDKNTFSWNASLGKTFHIREKARFQFHMNVNNILNHPSWGFGSANTYSTSFGVVGGPSGNRSMSLRGVLSF